MTIRIRLSRIFILIRAIYPETHPTSPRTDKRVFASYTYDDSATVSVPARLLTADDPHFDGAMTRIKYSYRNSRAKNLRCRRRTRLPYVFYAHENAIALNLVAIT